MKLIDQAQKSFGIIRQSIDLNLLTLDRCIELSNELEITIKELQSSPLQDEEFLKAITTLQLTRYEPELHITHLSTEFKINKSS